MRAKTSLAIIHIPALSAARKCAANALRRSWSLTNHAVFFSGSGDGRYCVNCDKELKQSNNPTHRAFMKIKELSDEHNKWQEDFKSRMDKAEKDLKSINRD